MTFCYNNPSACRGNDTCQEGYTGILCEECDTENNYSQSGYHHCSKCSKKGFLVLAIVGISLGYILIQFLSVYSVLRNGSDALIKYSLLKLFRYNIRFENQSSAILKIFIFHCHIFYLSYSLDMEGINALHVVSKAISNITYN